MAQSTQTQRKKNQQDLIPLDTFMLCEKFASPIILVCYDGMRVLAEVKQMESFGFTADVVQRDSQPTPVQFAKKQCLFAVPVEKWDVVKPHIKRRKAVTAMQLAAMQGLSQRNLVQKHLPRRKNVKVSLRNGLVLEGRIVVDDAYNMLMRVGKKIVLVWKHAVHEIHLPTAEEGEAEQPAPATS